LAIVAHSEVAPGLASPQTNPEGRIEPFGGIEFICDQAVVGTWVFVADPDRALLDAWTNEFKLDGEVLDSIRTPNKRIADQDVGGWWFAEGVPVLGVLDPGVHDVEFTFDDGLGLSLTFNTLVDVSAANC
jgi:hypothetical protein